MVRMTDVAEEAGVSVATVSRVLNGVSVRPDLEAAVREAVERLKYRPDRTARSLRRQTSEVIALIVADIENPFFTSFARGVEDVAHGHGFSVVLCNSDENEDKESRYLQIAVDENMAGVILVPAAGSTDLTHLLERKIAVVVADRELDQDLDHVLLDNVALGENATAELINNGFRRIACVTGPARVPTAFDRATGWRTALEKAHLPVDPELLIFTDFRVDGGLESVGRLLRLPEPPDAVVATNNLVGVGALRALAAAGADNVALSVIGDLPFATTIADNVWLTQLNTAAMGRVTATMLIDRILGKEDGPGRRAIHQGSRPSIPFNRGNFSHTVRDH